MEDPKISIIIPVYNTEKYLPSCIESALNQTYSNIEIICIDDGSTDTSGDLLDAYAKKDNRLKVVHKFNGGLSSSRNVGLERATGNIIMFLDSDDWLTRDTVLNIALSFRDDNIDCVTFGMEAYADGDITQNLNGMNRYLKLKYEGEVDFNFDRALKTNIHVCNKAFKAQNIKNLRFIQGLLYEDIFFMWYNFLHINKMMYLPDTYYKYRIHSGSIMESSNNIKSFEKAKDHLLNIHCLIDALENEPKLLLKNRLELEILILNNARRELELVESKEFIKVFNQKEATQIHLRATIENTERALLYGE